jgi:hypothetical protein
MAQPRTGFFSGEHHECSKSVHCGVINPTQYIEEAAF